LENTKLKKEIKQLLGFVNYTRKFVVNMSWSMKQMLEFMKDASSLKDLKNETFIKALKEEKQEIVKNICKLSFADKKKQYMLQFDTSNMGVKAILLQNANL
jgi:methylthioribose-1-phosphate isomerase